MPEPMPEPTPGPTAEPMPAGPRFAVGDRVRTRTVDPSHHTRLPRYARGQVGEVVADLARWTLADQSARGARAGAGGGGGGAARGEPVYTVRFTARDLWGEGDHHVTIDLWQTYLEPY